MYFAPGAPKHHGWALIGGRFITIDHPLPNDMSCGSWISDSGEVVDTLRKEFPQGVSAIGKAGQFTFIDLPGGRRTVLG
jgi:hypothetical protein